VRAGRGAAAESDVPARDGAFHRQHLLELLEVGDQRISAGDRAIVEPAAKPRMDLGALPSFKNRLTPRIPPCRLPAELAASPACAADPFDPSSRCTAQRWEMQAARPP